MLAALSTGHKIGLGLVGLAFIAFALASSFLFPRLSPNFPGEKGVRRFVGIAVVFFVGMLLSVYIFGKEPKEAVAGGAESVATTPGGTAAATTSAGTSQQTVKVSETEFKITLPSTTLAPGPVTFTASNDGKIAHNLVVKGPQVSNASTSVFGPGKSEPLKIALTTGTYELYCSVPGHKEAGMDIKITVGKA